MICLSGASGCGKTTIARILAFLTHPDSGTVSGLVPGETAMLFQEDRLLPWLSAARNVSAVCPMAEALRQLEAVGLAAAADAMPDELSGGMRRRVALARALAYPARLLILDEPFNGVDAATKQTLYPLIRAQAKSRPVLLITHHADEIAALANRVITLSGPPLTIVSDCTPT